MTEPNIDLDGTIPEGLVLVRVTDVFDNESVPAGLLRAHRVADGVWGRLVVRDGSVRFVFEDDPDGAVSVAKGEAVAIPPGRHHHVELDGRCAFVVEFYRQAPATEGGLESTGLA